MRATVIIPTHGRPAAVDNAVRSLLRLEPQRLDVELLVVDNNSDARLCAELQAACEDHGRPVRYVAEPSPGLSAARHRGADAARGEILIYVDDDIEASQGWLEAMLSAFDDTSIGVAGGPTVPLFTGSVPGWFWDFIEPAPMGGWCCFWLSLLDIGRTVFDVDPNWIFGLNFGIRASLVRELGGFHPDSLPRELQRWQGDGETGLTRKAKAAGVRARYHQEALLRHVIGPDRLTPEYFARRAYYQGVCDSYTSIRGGAEPSVADVVGPTSVDAPEPARGVWGSAAQAIRVAADAAYEQGRAFHQREALGDPRLLRWIRRESYWGADIRDELAQRG